MTAQPGGQASPSAAAAAQRASRWPAGLGGIPRALAALAERLERLDRTAVRMRTATIVSFASGQAVITLDGTTVTNVPYSAGYSPAIGHTVIVLQTRGQLVIINRPA